MSIVSPPAGGRRFTPMSEARGTHAAFLVMRPFRRLQGDPWVAPTLTKLDRARDQCRVPIWHPQSFYRLTRVGQMSFLHCRL